MTTTSRTPENREFFIRSLLLNQINKVTATSVIIEEKKLFIFKMKKLPKKIVSTIIAVGIPLSFLWFFFFLLSFFLKTVSYMVAVTPPHTNPNRTSSIPIAVPVIVNGDHQSIVYIIDTSGPTMAKRIETDSMSFLRSFLQKKRISHTTRSRIPISR